MTSLNSEKNPIVSACVNPMQIAMSREFHQFVEFCTIKMATCTFPITSGLMTNSTMVCPWFV